MRLHLSEKATRQLKGTPPQDCGEHPDTTYARVPKRLRAQIGYDWACADCLKAHAKKEEADRQAARADARAEKGARQAEIRQAKADAAKAHDDLVVLVDHALGAVKTADEAIAENTEGRVRAMAEVTDATHEVSAAERHLLEARRHLAEQKRRLADAKAAVVKPLTDETLAATLTAEAEAVEVGLGRMVEAMEELGGSARKKLMGRGGGREAVKAATKLLARIRDRVLPTRP